MSLIIGFVIFFLGYGILEKLGEGILLLRISEKRGRWGMVNGWRFVDRKVI